MRSESSGRRGSLSECYDLPAGQWAILEQRVAEANANPDGYLTLDDQLGPAERSACSRRKRGAARPCLGLQWTVGNRVAASCEPRTQPCSLLPHLGSLWLIWVNNWTTGVAGAGIQ